MRTILLIMKRKSVAQGLMLKLRDVPELELAYEEDYMCAAASINVHGADVALIEVAESGEYGISYCLELCARLKEATPGCKVLLMCPEQDRNSVVAVVRAKLEGGIDDFVFYDTSVDYLASKLSSM